MARISGVNIPDAKRVVISLTYIYGVGDTTAAKILVATGISANTRVKDPVSYTHLTLPTIYSV